MGDLHDKISPNKKQRKPMQTNKGVSANASAKSIGTLRPSHHKGKKEGSLQLVRRALIWFVS